MAVSVVARCHAASARRTFAGIDADQAQAARIGCDINLSSKAN